MADDGSVAGVVGSVDGAALSCATYAAGLASWSEGKVAVWGAGGFASGASAVKLAVCAEAGVGCCDEGAEDVLVGWASCA